MEAIGGGWEDCSAKNRGTGACGMLKPEHAVSTQVLHRVKKVKNEPSA